MPAIVCRSLTTVKSISFGLQTTLLHQHIAGRFRSFNCEHMCPAHEPVASGIYNPLRHHAHHLPNCTTTPITSRRHTAPHRAMAAKVTPSKLSTCSFPHPPCTKKLVQSLRIVRVTLIIAEHQTDTGCLCATRSPMYSRASQGLQQQ